MKKVFFLVATIVLVFAGLTINANSTDCKINQYCMSSDQSPRSGVIVQATNQSTHQSFSSESDLDGWAVISVPYGSYRMSGSSDGQTVQGSLVSASSSSVEVSSPLVFD